MSSDTAPSTSRRSDPDFPTICCAGFCSTALQSVYFRELLSVFSGNELSIGLIFSVWLFTGGAATALAAARYLTRSGVPGEDLAAGQSRSSITLLVTLLCVAAVWGFLAIRASRLVLGSGISMGPVAMLCVIAVSVVPLTFVNGFLLGTLFSICKKSSPLYGWENMGAVAGAFGVFMCIAFSLNNSLIAAASLVPFLCISEKRPRIAASVAVAALCLICCDHASRAWKYPGMHVSKILYGHEGEILPLATGSDTTFLVNGSLYKSTMEESVCEQAVHIPMAQISHAWRVLVVFDRGQGHELAKYPGTSVDIIETEPVFARGNPKARVAAAETMSPVIRYDAVLLGAPFPSTAASNRFYTRSFFLKMRSLLSDSGIISFTLPFSENYLSRSETRLRDALLSTLSGVWKHVMIFPGTGYTFMASDYTLLPIPRVRVTTSYLTSSIIPGVSEERITAANTLPFRREINTRDRPITLLLGLWTWLERFPGSMWIFVALLLVSLVAAVVMIPKTRDAFSVSTSGLVAGIYSVCLLLLYQATFGALYSRVSLLLVCLAAGFACGSLVKRFPLSDLAVGLYAAISLVVLEVIPFPQPFLFYLFHAGMGILAGAQFVTRKAVGPASLYSADLLGGAIGMAVCSTLLVPLFGIVSTGIGLLILKLTVEILSHSRKGRSPQ